jgi:hypothetical protein
MTDPSIQPPQSAEAQSLCRKGFTRTELLAILVVLSMAGILCARLLPRSAAGRTEALRVACLNNLKSIGQGLQTYLESNGNHWPCVAKLSSMELHTPPWPTLPSVLSGLVPSKDVFHCPADRRELSADSALLKSHPRETTWFETEGTSYEWSWGDAYCGKKVGDETLAKAKGFGMGRADQPLLADFGPFHKGDDKGSINRLNADLKPRTSREKGK